MKHVVLMALFLSATVWSLSEEAEKIGARFAQMKAKTHQNLAPTKDNTSLIARIDSDLQGLKGKIHSLDSLKHELIVQKEVLSEEIDKKTKLHRELMQRLEAQMQAFTVQLGVQAAIVAQKSIQEQPQAVAPAIDRATLLGQVFSVVLTPSTLTVPLLAHNVRYGVEDIRG